MSVRRARGVILRLVRRRPLAVAVGAAMAVPAFWLKLSGGSGAWWVEGMAVVLAATGAALLWAGLTGPRADWID